MYIYSIEVAETLAGKIISACTAGDSCAHLSFTTATGSLILSI